MLNFFKKKPSALCNTSVLLQYIQCASGDDTSASIVNINYDGLKHKLGFFKALNNKAECCDTIYFLDDQEFKSFSEFSEKAMFEGVKFRDFDKKIEVWGVDDKSPCIINLFEPYEVKED